MPPAFIDYPQTVNQTIYKDILQGHFIPNLPENHNLVYMHDGATAHTANSVKDFLYATFGEDNVISRNCKNSWPSRSPNINPCDFFLWGYLKHRVFSRKPTSLQQIKDFVNEEVANIPAEVLSRTNDSLFDRLLLLKTEAVHHIEN